MLEEFLAVDVSAPSQDELFQKIEEGKKKVSIITCTIALNFDMILQVIITLVVVYDINIFTSRVRSSIPDVIIKWAFCFGLWASIWYSSTHQSSFNIFISHIIRPISSSTGTPTWSSWLFVWPMFCYNTSSNTFNSSVDRSFHQPFNHPSSTINWNKWILFIR